MIYRFQIFSKSSKTSDKSDTINTIQVLQVIQTIQAGNTSNVIIAIASIESNACIKRNARCASGKRIAINAIDTSNVINVSDTRDASLKIALQSAFLGQPILRANNASNMRNAKNSRKPSKESQLSNAS